MIEINIPGKRLYQFKTLVLDVNGTITLDGKLIDGVAARINALKKSLEIFLITADTHGNAGKLADFLGVQLWRIEAGNEAEQKLAFVRECGSNSTVTIGNGMNDRLALHEAALGICVAGNEGAATEAVQSCDILVTNINAALDLLLNPKRPIATLRE